MARFVTLLLLAGAAAASSMRGALLQRAFSNNATVVESGVKYVRVEKTFQLKTVTDCGNGQAAGTWSSLTLTPDPPVAGQPAKLAGTGTVNEAITSGSGTGAVSLDGLQVFSADLNTCGETQINLPLGIGTLDINALQCPTTAGGAITIGVTITVPTIAPSGNYDVKMTANDQNGNLAFCVDAQFSL